MSTYLNNVRSSFMRFFSRSEISRALNSNSVLDAPVGITQRLLSLVLRTNSFTGPELQSASASPFSLVTPKYLCTNGDSKLASTQQTRPSARSARTSEHRALIVDAARPFSMPEKTTTWGVPCVAVFPAGEKMLCNNFSSSRCLILADSNRRGFFRETSRLQPLAFSLADSGQRIC